MNTRKTTIFATMGLLLISAPSVLVAAEYEAEVRAGVGVSDNIGRSPATGVDETIATVGFDFAVTEETRRLDLDIRSNVDYMDYLDDTFDAELVGGVVAYAEFTLAEERLVWLVEDTFGQQLVDPLEAARPGNRENVNYFTTGPTLSLLPGSRNSIELEALYSSVNFEERPFDNERGTGTVRIGRETSRDTSVSLVATAIRIEFDDELANPPIDQHEAYIRYEKTGAQNTLSLDIGFNRVKYQGDEGDGVLAGITWAYTPSPNSVMTVTGGSRYSDQGDIFEFYQDSTGDLSDTVDGAATAAPFSSSASSSALRGSSSLTAKSCPARANIKLSSSKSS